MRNSSLLNVSSNHIQIGDIVYLKKGDIVPVDMKITNIEPDIYKEWCTLFKEDSKWKELYKEDKILVSDQILSAGSTITKNELNGEALTMVKDSVFSNMRKTINNYYRSHTLLSHKFYCLHKILCYQIYFVLCCLPFVAILLVVLSFYSSLSIYKIIQLITELTWAIIIDYSIIFVCMISCFFGCIKLRKTNNISSCRGASLINYGLIDTVIVQDNGELLCEHQLTIGKVWMDKILVNGDEAVSKYEEERVKHSPTWTALTRAAVLCNDADMSPWFDDSPVINRECTEAITPVAEVNSIPNTREVDESLLKSFSDCDSVKKWGGSLARYRKNNKTLLGPKIDRITGCKISIHQLIDGDSRMLMILQGNVNQVLKCCSSLMVMGKETLLDKELRNDIITSYNELSQQFHVVQAFSDFRLNPDKFPENISSITHDMENELTRSNLRFLGMIAFSSSLKEKSITCFKEFAKMGIKVVLTSTENKKSLFNTIAKSQKNSVPQLDFNQYTNYPCTRMNNTRSDDSKSVKFCTRNDNPVENLSSIQFLINYTNDEQLGDFIFKLQLENRNVAFITSLHNQFLPILSSNISVTAEDNKIKCCHGNYGDISISTDNIQGFLSNVINSRCDLMPKFKEAITFLIWPKFFFIFAYLSLIIFGSTCPVNFSFIASFELCSLISAIAIIQIPINLNKTIYNCKYYYPHVLILLEMASIQIAAGVATYLLKMTAHGFWPMRLLWIRDTWYSSAINDLTDSYGQEWTFSQRQLLDLEVATSVFYTIIVVQLIGGWFTSTKSISLFNCNTIKQVVLLIVAGIFSIALAIWLIYIGYYYKIMEFYCLRLTNLLYPAPFIVFLVIYYEVKKCLLRRTKSAESLFY